MTKEISENDKKYLYIHHIAEHFKDKNFQVCPLCGEEMEDIIKRDFPRIMEIYKEIQKNR
jgi:hypothetical protein